MGVGGDLVPAAADVVEEGGAVGHALATQLGLGVEVSVGATSS